MAEPDAKAPPAGGASSGPARPPKPPNPVWRMMGLPNFRFKLPSRNWMIFLSITGTWTAAVMYDRREKRRIQRKWTKVVEHIAQETIDEHQMPRKMTIYIGAPPADGLVPAREHFNEYVKPILVAAALDWDAIEGRREGDVRAGLAERIRKLRKKRGEQSAEPIEEGLEDLYEAIRQNSGVKEWNGPGGDIVIGRHTWKEYIRGLHEGWLGPLDPPPVPAEEIPAAPVDTPFEAAPAAPATPAPTAEGTSTTPVQTLTEAVSNASDDASPTAAPKTEEAEKPKEDENKSKKKKQPPPFISTSEYESAALSPFCPPALGPSAAVPLPHLLGFLNFPIRMYRFLNRRKVADDVGRQTAAAVLGAYQLYDAPTTNASVGDDGPKWEQEHLLQNEEPDWHKTARERKDDNGKERVWLDDMVLDPRIAERMRKFVINADDEDRANRLASEKQDSWFSSLWAKTEKQKQPWEGLTDDE
ncbi:hypothetical protein BS50DRAFT_579790 [Corynespora cassiicola Philippines]|uniref:Mitochondrial import inner membrane translocase subunit TIM54 n=1 Tax=Corynespora cassiicola Philippines TaxID=1448308 RepID=A0A2T2N2V8_CORCC|nr:hypothetical protein BS50DRAFT_579790 [Corynespora cassiicola Philippines]